jgi:lipoprotein-anchoring transpeptidase ErfK/SrfK
MKLSKTKIMVCTAAVLVTGAVAMQVPDTVFRSDTATAIAPASPESSIALRIDISDRKLYVEQNGEVVKSYTVTVGTSAHPTPRGNFGIKHIVWNPRWVPPDEPWAKNKTAKGPGEKGNPMGKVKLFFNEPDYYIHGTLTTSELGTAASHGCVRMRNSDVIDLAGMVMDHGGAQVEEGFIRRKINNVRTTKQVRLQRAVPVRIEG